MCPSCRKAITMKRIDGIESCLITCPHCNYKGEFKKFPILEDKIPDKETPPEIPGNKNDVPPEIPGRNKDVPPEIPKNLGKTPPPPPPPPLTPGYPPPPPEDVDGGHSTFNLSPGLLHDMSTGRNYELRRGRNVIGRQSDSSPATIQIPTNGDNHMSRDHLVIEVSMVPGKGLVAVASLSKAEVNSTYINGEIMTINSRVELKSGDSITMPGNRVLKYEIPDSEETVM